MMPRRVLFVLVLTQDNKDLRHININKDGERHEGRGESYKTRKKARIEI